MGVCCSCLRGGGALDDSTGLPIAENEREAVTSLLEFLEHKEEYDFYMGKPLRALTTLVYSDNLNLQRSAALAFAEITEKYVSPVSRDVLEPILMLLTNADAQIRIASCAALGNLAVNNENKLLIVEMGGLEPLIEQMKSDNVEVQCNAVGCITNLATQDDNKIEIAQSGALVPLTKLARSSNIRVQRNATGALLNMTHSGENRKELVDAGAVPVLVSLLSSGDADVQYYCTTALSNIAVDEVNRRYLSKHAPKLVTKLVSLMNSNAPRVKCQATLALRNLASDTNYQLEIVRAGGLPDLAQLIQSDSLPLVLASVACIRNISIHPLNEGLIVDAGFLGPLVNLLDYVDSEEIQCHAVSTLRNLAASSEKNRAEFFQAGVVDKFKELALNCPISVQSEISACFAILALSDNTKYDLLQQDVLKVLIPMTKSQDQEISGNSAAAVANLISRVSNLEKILEYWNQPNDGIKGFLLRFILSDFPTYEHIALWTILQLFESHNETIYKLIKEDQKIVNGVKRIADENYSIARQHLKQDNKSGDINAPDSSDASKNDDSTYSNRQSNDKEDASFELYNITQQIIQFLV